jgi:hypothetical protein
MKQILNILLLGSALLFVSCEETHLPVDHTSLVVEGWIENGRPPVVILSRPVTITSDYQYYDNLSEYIIRWAKVSVVCEEDTVVLTGKFTPDYLPNYIYTTGRMMGEVGKTYTLIVEYGDQYATAETTILPPPHVVDYEVCPKEGNDTLYQINVQLSDIEPHRNYYQCFYKIGQYSKQYFTTYLGTFDDEVIDYEQPIPIFKGNNLFTEGDDYTPYFAKGDSVSVKISHIDEGAYHFWDTYSQNVSLSYNMFLSNAKLMPTNVIGGSGFWCGMGSSSLNIIIPTISYKEE